MSGGGRLRVNQAESPLAWLRSRKGKGSGVALSEEEFEAGERLRHDFTVACLEPRITSSWEGVNGAAQGRGAPRPESLMLTERALAAKDRVFRALDAVGPELSGVLTEVCCLASGLEAAERRLGWPRRTAKVVLKMALTRLARHYGLIRPHAPGCRPVLHWGAEGYRPEIPEA